MSTTSKSDDSGADALMGEIVDDFLERIGRGEIYGPTKATKVV